MGDYVIKPQYTIDSNRPIGYNIFKNDERITGRDTLKEAKTSVESMVT